MKHHRKQIDRDKKDLKQLKIMRDKIGQNLQLFRSEVDDKLNKEKE